MAFPLFALIWARNVMLRPERLLAWHHRYRLAGMAAGAAAFIALLALNSQHLQEIPVTVVVLAILPTVLLPAAAVSAATSPAAERENRFIPASFFYLAIC